MLYGFDSLKISLISISVIVWELNYSGCAAWFW